LNPGVPGLAKSETIRLGLGLLFFLIGISFKITGAAELGLFLTAYLLVGADVLTRAAKNIFHG